MAATALTLPNALCSHQVLLKGCIRCRRRCFVATINNPTEDEISFFKDLSSDNLPDYLVYVRCQPEVSSSGTNHLQIYAEKKQASTFTALISKVSAFARAHLEHSMNSAASNNYCYKEDTWDKSWRTTVGSMGADRAAAGRTRGVATNLATTAAVKTMIQSFSCWEDVINSNDQLVSSYVEDHLLLARQVFDATPIKCILPSLTPLQRVVRWLFLNQNDREFLWIVDLDGNSGKTTLAKSLTVHDGATLMSNRSAENAFLISSKKLYIWNLSRTAHDRINYESMEQTKDGFVCSTKYSPVVKCTSGNKVLVLANCFPDYTALSADRWNVNVVRNGGLKKCVNEGSIHCPLYVVPTNNLINPNAEFDYPIPDEDQRDQVVEDCDMAILPEEGVAEVLITEWAELHAAKRKSRPIVISSESDGTCTSPSYSPRETDMEVSDDDEFDCPPNTILITDTDEDDFVSSSQAVVKSSVLFASPRSEDAYDAADCLDKLRKADAAFSCVSPESQPMKRRALKRLMSDDTDFEAV